MKTEPNKALERTRMLVTNHLFLTSFGHASRQAHVSLSFDVRQKKQKHGIDTI
jgi:hypothetical protein